MTIIQFLQQQLEQEGNTTRRMLQRIPDDKLDWQPHEKSMTIKRLASHIAELPTWIGMVLHTDELDFENNPYQPVDITSTAQLLEFFEKNLAEGKAQLVGAKEEVLDKIWTLRSGANIFSAEPKVAVMRMALSQIIHHRAQLGVYLRLLDVPIPGSYGPSADENNF
ncbi:putative damage-inducible protein DinB [Filimonas zeae]|nr:DinB family protein [Filimonas zeae]MDR6342384.1 putative damage-inducible protein DinB [Filimonas zeae]